MKTLILIATAALAVPVAAFAERTTTFDGPKVEATRVTVRDKAAGTYSRDTTARRASDGATASGTYDRTRTETGIVVSGTATGFAGNTRSYAYGRSRTDDGYSATGTATGRNGEIYTLAGQGARNDTGYTRSQSVTNASGTALYDRNVVASRANGQFTRDVSVSRAAGFDRPGFGGGRRH